jgi:hypothetical protein
MFPSIAAKIRLLTRELSLQNPDVFASCAGAVPLKESRVATFQTLRP